MACAGLTNGATQENRRLSIDLAGLIVYWEQKAIEAGATTVQVAFRLTCQRRPSNWVASVNIYRLLCSPLLYCLGEGLTNRPSCNMTLASLQVT